MKRIYTWYIVRYPTASGLDWRYGCYSSSDMAKAVSASIFPDEKSATIIKVTTPLTQEDILSKEYFKSGENMWNTMSKAAKEARI